MITEQIAKKVLETVDAGLVQGVGKPVPGQMCVEAAVCYAMGLPHSDDPQCISRAVRALKIALNDSPWSSPAARAKGMRRLALVQLGSAGIINDKEFAKRVTELTIKTAVPAALRAAASVQPDEHRKGELLDAALRCEREGKREAAAEAAAWAAWAATRAAAWARDKVLSDFAEGVVQILIEMNAPGVQWLPLTED